PREPSAVTVETDTGALGPAPPTREPGVRLDHSRAAHLTLGDAPALAAHEQVGAALPVHDTDGPGAAFQRGVERGRERVREEPSPGCLVPEVDDLEARPPVTLDRPRRAHRRTGDGFGVDRAPR